MLFKTQFRSIRMKPSKKQQIVNFQIHNTHTIQLNDIHFVQKGDLFIEKENGHSTFKVNMKNTCVRERERERDTWRRCWGEGALASASANGSQC